MTCRPHHALCPARDGGKCVCEPLSAEERHWMRVALTDGALCHGEAALRLLHERDQLERETITTRVSCARCGEGVRPREMADGRCAECLRLERDAARRLADRLACDLRRVAGDCAGCSPHDCETAALLQECGREEIER